MAWSRTLYQSADQRLKDRIVFAVVQTRQWTLQRLHDDKLCMSFSNQLLPMRRGQCVVRIEEKAMLSPVYIGNLEVSWTRFANSKAHVRVEIHVEQKRTAMEPIIMSTCCGVETCDNQFIFERFVLKFRPKIPARPPDRPPAMIRAMAGQSFSPAMNIPAENSGPNFRIHILLKTSAEISDPKLRRTIPRC